MPTAFLQTRPTAAQLQGKRPSPLSRAQQAHGHAILRPCRRPQNSRRTRQSTIHPARGAMTRSGPAPRAQHLRLTPSPAQRAKSFSTASCQSHGLTARAQTCARGPGTSQTSGHCLSAFQRRGTSCRRPSARTRDTPSTGASAPTLGPILLATRYTRSESTDVAHACTPQCNLAIRHPHMWARF